MSLPPCPAPGPHGSGLAGCPSPAECREAGKALEGCPGPAPSQHQRGGVDKEEERDLGNHRCGWPRRVSEVRAQGIEDNLPLILFTSCAPPSFLLSKNPLTAGSFPVSGVTKPCDTIGCCAKISLPREQASCTAIHCNDTSLYPGILEAKLRQGHWHDFKTSLNYNVREVLSLKTDTQKPDVWNGVEWRGEQKGKVGNSDFAIQAPAWPISVLPHVPFPVTTTVSEELR